MTTLEPDELAIEEALEDAAFASVDGVDARIAAAQMLAVKSLKKDKSITIRMAESDIRSLKRIAANEGIPYQTLITSLLHKFAAGRSPEL